jgi:hypothetical protein
LKERLIASGMLTGHQIAATLGVGRNTIGRMRREGRLEARICNNRGEWLYWPPDAASSDPNINQPAAADAAMNRSPARGAM